MEDLVADHVAYGADLRSARLRPQAVHPYLIYSEWRGTLSNPKYAGHQMSTEYRGFKPSKIAPKRPRRTSSSELVPCGLPPIFSLMSSIRRGSSVADVGRDRRAGHRPNRAN
jgi:hypothetical protein